MFQAAVSITAQQATGYRARYAMPDSVGDAAMAIIVGPPGLGLAVCSAAQSVHLRTTGRLEYDAWCWTRSCDPVCRAWADYGAQRCMLHSAQQPQTGIGPAMPGEAGRGCLLARCKGTRTRSDVEGTGSHSYGGVRVVPPIRMRDLHAVRLQGGRAEGRMKTGLAVFRGNILTGCGGRGAVLLPRPICLWLSR